MGAEISENLVILFGGNKTTIPVQKRAGASEETMRKQAKEAGAIYVMAHLETQIAVAVTSAALILQTMGMGMNAANNWSRVTVPVLAAVAVNIMFGIATVFDFCKTVLSSLLGLGTGNIVRCMSAIFSAVDAVTQGVTWYFERNGEPEDPPKPEDRPPVFDPREGFGDSRFFLRDPLALDLNGDGMEFVRDGAYFDYDGGGKIDAMKFVYPPEYQQS